MVREKPHRTHRQAAQRVEHTLRSPLRELSTPSSGHIWTSSEVDIRKLFESRLPRQYSTAAKRRKNAAHVVRRGVTSENRISPVGRKTSSQKRTAKQH